MIGMTLALVCISGSATGCGALMRGKFVLAKHGQIYEPARLSSSALTDRYKYKDSSGRLYHMGNWDPPNMVVCEGAVSQAVSTNDAFYKSRLVHFGLILLLVYMKHILTWQLLLSACSCSSTLRTMLFRK